MRCVVVLLVTLPCIICNAIVQHSAYNPVFEYDVPVASQPIVYGPHYGSYYGSGYGSAYRSGYAVTPVVSHSYSQTQTHPVAYVKPVNVFGPPSGQYYAAPSAAATSRVEQSRLIVPQTNRIYRYQASTNQQYAYPQSTGTQNQNQGFQGGNRAVNQQIYSASAQYNENQNQNHGFQGGNRAVNQQTYSAPAQYNENQNPNHNNGYNRNVYAQRMPYSNNGEQVKLRRYQIHRPGIKKEFYDVEERVIVRPAGSALIELDPPTKKQEIKEYGSNDVNQASNQQPSQQQYNSRGFRPSDQSGSSNAQYNQGAYFSTPIPNCGYGGYPDQSPVYAYSPPATSFGNPGTQYHPTTFAPSTTTTTSATSTEENYSTTGYPTTVPSQTYLPPYPTEQSFTSTSSTQDLTYSSTPGQYTTTTTAAPSTTAKQSDIYVSSTTPVSVIIVDKNEDSYKNNTKSQGQDIIYAGQGQSDDENTSDQFQNELPPRGDISQYRAEQPDQFYHELPRSRYSNEPDQPNVYARSNGERSEDVPFYSGKGADVVEIEPKSNNLTNNQNDTSYQQARLIQLYTDNGGISEVGQTENQAQYQDQGNQNAQYQDQGNQNAQYQDVGKVRARVVSVTPPPATAIPTETVNRRRIVVSKPVTTVVEVVEADNSTTSAQSREGNNANGQYQNEQYQNGQYQNGQDQNGNSYSQRSNSEFRGNYQNDAEYVPDGNSKNGATGVFISTTPSSASQRIIYVQPVSQDFAQQRAVPPKKPKT